MATAGVLKLKYRKNAKKVAEKGKMLECWN